MLPTLLITAWQQGRLLLLWANLPLALLAQPPANPALLLSQWLVQAGEMPSELIAGLPGLPPLSILSLEPADRLERAFQGAGVPLHLVTTRREVPVRGRPNLLKLGGDLVSRSGVILSRAALGELHADPDKAYLLAEARRIVKDGALLLLGADPAHEDFRAWWAVVYPALDSPAAWALGPPEADWPAGVTPLAADLAQLAAELAALVPEIQPAIQLEERIPMSAEDKLLTIHKRRLQILREKEAVFGANTPPEILIEIEDLEAKIRALQGGSPPAASPVTTPAQPGSTVYNINIQQASGLAIGDRAQVTQSHSEPGRPTPGQTPAAGVAWNTSAIRDLLNAAFDDESLTYLCYDFFPEVHQTFGGGMTKGQKIQQLLDYCKRQDRLADLLQQVQARNPAQYRQFEARLGS